MSGVVYTGIWINWSLGRVRGTTLTLPQQYGGVLAAFLAIYVTFVGTMFWRIVRFALHQLNTTDVSQKRDLLHYQRQVILRNTGAGSATLDFAFLSLRHWRKASNPILRCVPFALMALFNLLLFGAAGLLTSEVTKVPGNSTLVLGPSCGGWKPHSNLTDFSPYTSKKLADTYEAATYVRQCYQNNTSGLPCGTYMRPSLPFVTNANATCPFASGLCIDIDNSAFSMDTGPLDSHEDFGINSEPENRIQFRRVTTCAPIHAKQFGSIYNDPDAGPTIIINAGPCPPLDRNYTFSYANHTMLDGVGYQLSHTFSTASLGINEWNPHPDLNRTDADITLMMLAQNSVSYLAPSDDTWMPAHKKIPGVEEWWGDYDVNLLGCIEQLQICNPNVVDSQARCSKLTGLLPLSRDVFGADNPIKLNLHQQWTVRRFLVGSPFKTMDESVRGRGAAALNVFALASEDVQPAIPATQWHKEVSIWFSISLAKEQEWAVEWATAPRNFAPVPAGEPLPYIPTPPSDPIPKQQCNSQLIHNAGTHQSFSVLGMALILGLGGLIILLGLTIDVVVGWLRSGRARYRKDQWMAEETLELHKAAYSALGLWQESRGEMPPSSIFLTKNR